MDRREVAIAPIDCLTKLHGAGLELPVVVVVSTPAPCPLNARGVAVTSNKMASVVPPFKLWLPQQDIDEITDAVQDILSRGTLLLGPYTSRLESAFAARLNRGSCVAVSSGTTALEIILRYLNIGTRKILVPANTNYATALAVLNAGGTVELYDSGLYPCWNSLRDKLDDSIAAVIVVHIGGYISPDILAIKGLCDQRGIPLVEDAAHAHGSRYDNRAAGALSYASAFSLFPTKVMTSGEGGLIVTDDPGLATAARQMRNQGKDEIGRHVLLGNSWRITEIGAAIALTQLRRLDDACQYRLEIIRRYVTAAKKSRLLKPVLPAVGCTPNGYKAIFLTEQRGDVIQKLDERGIRPSGNVYDDPLYELPVFQKLLRGPYPTSEQFARAHVCLPCWYGMGPAQVNQVATAIEDM